MLFQQHDKENKRLYKYYLISVAVLVFCVPDLLVHIHELLGKIPLVGNQFHLNSVQYAQTEAGILMNLVAIIISIMAFRSADYIRSMQQNEYKFKADIRMRKLADAIRRNSKIIYEVYRHETGLQVKELDEHMKKSIAYLYAVHIINDEQKVMCIKCVELVSDIIQFHEHSEDAEERKAIEKYCNEFLDKSLGKLVFNYKMQQLLEQLER